MATSTSCYSRSGLQSGFTVRTHTCIHVHVPCKAKGDFPKYGGGGAKRSKCVAQAHSELGGSGGSYSRRFYRVSLLRYMPCVSLSVG